MITRLIAGALVLWSGFWICWSIWWGVRSYHHHSWTAFGIFVACGVICAVSMIVTIVNQYRHEQWMREFDEVWR